MTNKEKEMMAVRKYMHRETYARESDLLKDALEFLELLPETQAVRYNADVESGISDILICYHGYFVAVELKDDTGKATPQQCKFLSKVRDAEGTAGICRNIQDIWRLLVTCQCF